MSRHALSEREALWGHESNARGVRVCLATPVESRMDCVTRAIPPPAREVAGKALHANPSTPEAAPILAPGG